MEKDRNQVKESNINKINLFIKDILTKTKEMGSESLKFTIVQEKLPSI